MARIHIYSLAWLSILLLALVLRFAVLPPGSSGRAALPFLYMASTWIPVIVFNIREGKELMGYLASHHREKWEWLTTVPGLGPGNVNSFRSLPWLFSSDDLNDPTIAALKIANRRFIILALVIFFSYILVLPVLGS